jgi:hypothetical protein
MGLPFSSTSLVFSWTLLLFLSKNEFASAFTPVNLVPSIIIGRGSYSASSNLFTFYNDFEEDDFLGDAQDDTEISSNESSDLYAALRQRQNSLGQSRQRNMQAWK